MEIVSGTAWGSISSITYVRTSHEVFKCKKLIQYSIDLSLWFMYWILDFSNDTNIVRDSTLVDNWLPKILSYQSWLIATLPKPQPRVCLVDKATTFNALYLDVLRRKVNHRLISWHIIVDTIQTHFQRKYESLDYSSSIWCTSRILNEGF